MICMMHYTVSYCYTVQYGTGCHLVHDMMATSGTGKSETRAISFTHNIMQCEAGMGNNFNGSGITNIGKHLN